MKKILTAVVLGFAAHGVMAASTFDATAARTASVTSTDCAYLKDTAKISLSVGVALGFDCSTTAAAVGAGSIKGKGVTYSGSSNGGPLTESTDTAAASITGTTAKAKATAALSGS